jgi:hypothetical protein
MEEIPFQINVRRAQIQRKGKNMLMQILVLSWFIGLCIFFLIDVCKDALGTLFVLLLLVLCGFGLIVTEIVLFEGISSVLTLFGEISATVLFGAYVIYRIKEEFTGDEILFFFFRVGCSGVALFLGMFFLGPLSPVLAVIAWKFFDWMAE